MLPVVEPHKAESAKVIIHKLHGEQSLWNRNFFLSTEIKNIWDDYKPVFTVIFKLKMFISKHYILAHMQSYTYQVL